MKKTWFEQLAFGLLISISVAVSTGCILTLFLRLGRNGSSPAESEHE
jgi:hypothetical protein